MDGKSYIIEKYVDDRILDALSRHRCVACGACCRWRGQVFLYPDDIKRLAEKLMLTVEQFLIRWCVVVWWTWDDTRQFRIGLARKDVGNECVFLEGNLCSIHEFKPLLCKAGPAAWGWLWNPKYFWHFVQESPSFRHSTGGLSRDEANHWFVSTRSAEAAASHATSLTTLAEVSGISEEVLQVLPVVEFKEEVC